MFNWPGTCIAQGLIPAKVTNAFSYLYMLCAYQVTPVHASPIASQFVSSILQVNKGKVYAFGQCNLFTREMYDELGGHREIGHLVAESHALASMAVEKKLAFRCQCAFKQASMYWYNDFWECWKVSVTHSLLPPPLTRHYMSPDPVLTLFSHASPTHRAS